MTLERMYPGRAFLGLGSGEALNEVPVGDDWPSTGDQIARLDEALGIIDRLWSGGTITEEGRFYRLRDCKLHTLADRGPPIWVSAFGPQAAAATACGRCPTPSPLRQNNSGADPLGAIDVLGRDVLPALRSARV